jgi:hypothetical protein
MNNLKLTYSDVWTKVSEFFGLGSSPTGTDLTKCKNATLRAYRRFLFPLDLSQNPPKTYRWKFLEKTTTLSTEADTDEYNLPDGFSKLIHPFTHTTPVSFNPRSKPLSFIYEMKATSTGTGYPKYFALKIGEYDQITGQRDKVVFWPTPSDTYTYYFTYILTPPKPINDGDYFIGDAYASECILESALAMAELEKDDKSDVHAKEAERLIQASIGREKEDYLIRELGMMANGKYSEYIRYAVITDTEGTQILPEP